MRHITIPPPAGSELADLLSRLEAAETESYKRQQVLAHLRGEYEVAETRWRRSVYAGPASRPEESQIEDRVADMDNIRERQESATRAARAPLALVQQLALDFDRAYAQFLRQERAKAG